MNWEKVFVKKKFEGRGVGVWQGGGVMVDSNREVKIL